jgi:uncharacterized membrane protein
MAFLRRLRAYFLAGLVVIAPIAITIWLAWWFVSLFDQWVKPFIPSLYNPDTYLPFTVPGVGLVFALIGITLIGALAANLVGRTILSFWERILNRMPVVRSIYKATKQIFQTAFSESANNFQYVGLVEYPRKGVHVVVFVARELDSQEIGLAPNRKLYSCFMPTTPNPTSGFLFFLDKKEVTILDLTVEEGAKLVISAGLVTPKQIHEGHGLPGIDDEAAELIVKKHGVKKPATQKPTKKKASRKTKA